MPAETSPGKKTIKIEKPQSPVTSRTPIAAKVRSPIAAKVRSPVAAKVRSPVAAKGRSPVAAKRQSPVAAKGRSPVATKGRSPVAAKGGSPVAVKTPKREVSTSTSWQVPSTSSVRKGSSRGVAASSTGFRTKRQGSLQFKRRKKRSFKRRKKITPENREKLVARLGKQLPVTRILGDFIGKPTASRSEAVRHIWDYIKLNKLQDPDDGRIVQCDPLLSRLFNGSDFVHVLEIPGLLNGSFSSGNHESSEDEADIPLPSDRMPKRESKAEEHRVVEGQIKTEM